MKTLSYISAFILFTTYGLFAQEIRTGAAIRYSLLREVTLEGEGQYRFQYHDISVNRILYQGTLRYRSDKGFGAAIGARAVEDEIDRRRFFTDVLYSPKNDERMIWTAFRIRYQNTVKEKESFREGNHRIRLQGSFTFNISKLARPYISSEIYYDPEHGLPKKLRMGLGLNSRINRSVSLNSFYRIDKRLYESTRAEHILGVMLIYKIKTEDDLVPEIQN